MFENLKKKIAGAVFKQGPKKAFVPFDLRNGSKLRITSNVPTIYGSLCNKLQEKYGDITSVGTFNLSDSKVFRFYTDSGHFLQVFVDAESKITECRLFHTQLHVKPGDQKGWLEWIAEQTGNIGLDQLTLLDRLFYRLDSWADPDPDWVPGIHLEESIITSTGKSYTKQHYAMAYGRWLSDHPALPEYALISSEDHTSPEKGIFNSEVTVSYGIDIFPHEVDGYVA